MIVIYIIRAQEWGFKTGKPAFWGRYVKIGKVMVFIRKGELDK